MRFDLSAGAFSDLASVNKTQDPKSQGIAPAKQIKTIVKTIAIPLLLLL